MKRLSESEIATILRGAEDLSGRAGRNVLTKILKGSKDKAVLEHGYDRTPVYGTLNELTLEAIQHRVDWVIQNDYLHLRYNGRLPMLVYSDKGLAIECKTICDELVGYCQGMARSGGPYLMTFLQDWNRQTILRLLDALGDLADPDIIPLLEAWKDIAVKKVRARIQQVIHELCGQGPSLRMYFETCLVDESVSRELIYAWCHQRGTPGCDYEHLLNVRDHHAGMQDIEIIQRLLDRKTCLLTTDAAFHNAALAKGKYSFYLRDDGVVRNTPLPNIKLRGILASSEPMVPRLLPDKELDAVHTIAAAICPEDHRRQKSMRTKRRRIRNYIGGVANIDTVIVTVSQQAKRGGGGVLIGIRLRVSARSSGLKALDASESYIHDRTADPLGAFCHVLTILLQLQLTEAPVCVFYDSTCLRPPSEVSDSIWGDAFACLAGLFFKLEWMPCAKGRFIERLRSKLTTLQRGHTNEIVAQDFAPLAQCIATTDSGV